MNPATADILAVVTMHPGRPGLVNPALIEYLRSVGIPLERTLWNHQVNRYDATVTFNHAIAAALATPHAHFLFADFDMAPSPQRTAAFWEATADVVGARFEAGDHAGWEAGQIHSGFWRASRKALEGVPSRPGRPRWFEWAYADDGGRHAGCHCVAFCQRLLSAGCTVEVAGEVGHLTADRRGY